MTAHRNNSCSVKKYPYIHGYFVATFQHFNGTGSVWVCIRKSTEARANIAMWDRTNVGPGFIIPLIYGYKRTRNRSR